MTRSSRYPTTILFCLGTLFCLLVTINLPAQREKSKQLPEKTIGQWIEDLSSVHFAVREAATRALMDLEDEPPALRKALRSADLEMRMRIMQILEAHTQKRAPRGLRKACLLAKEGRVDEMLERLVLWKECKEQAEGLRAVADLAVRLVEWEHRTFGNTGLLSKNSRVSLGLAKDSSPDDPITLRELADLWSRSPHHLGREIVLRSREVDLMHPVILASENVRAPGVHGSIVISGGSIQMQYGPKNSIIICDDDLEVSHGLSGCLVVARGKITCQKDSQISGCTLLSGGPLVCSKSAKLTSTSILNVHRANSPVKFFDPQTLGLTVWQLYQGDKPFPPGCQLVTADGKLALGSGVWIKDVRPGTAFSDGLCAGDIVTAIDEKKTQTTDVFRKVLRRKLAEGGPVISFTIRRSGKTFEVPIPVKD
jgi:hypothetical protein